MKKKHLFKKRYNKPKIKYPQLIYGNANFFSLKKQRFDFVFLRFVKKKIRRRYCKVKMRFFKPRFWLFLKSNFICSMKSKNARMGAGVGALVRLVMEFTYNFIFIEFKYYSLYFLVQVLKFLEFKCSLQMSLNYG